MKTLAHKPAPTSPVTKRAPAPAARHPALALQRALGNQGCRLLLEMGIVRPALRVSHPSDASEQQAEQLARQALSAAAPRPCAACAGGKPCPECERQKKDIHRKPATPIPVPPVADGFAAGLGPGEPLSNAARADFEPRFGADFSAVRVHRDASAARSARQIEARAYTLGNHIVFDSGEFDSAADAGRRLLAHELAHVVQQAAAPPGIVHRSVGGTGTGAGGGTPPATGGGAAPGAPSRISVDVLSARDPEDFLVRAAAQNLGVDIRVRSLDDMITQVAALASGNTCVSQLSVFNHGNPSHQAVVGGSKMKTPTGERVQSPTEGFSLTWLLENSHQAALNRLRNSLCCHAALNWFGCSTAGVWAQGGVRTEAERRSSAERYTGTLGEFYHDVGEALAHGATRFRYVGPALVQSWSNALCASITAATDFNNWTTSRGTVSHTVIYGGQQLTFRPQSDMTCACDPATGRTTGAAPTGEQLRAREAYLREYYLRPLFQQVTGAVGVERPIPAETPQQRTEREQAQARQAALYTDLGNQIRDAVLARAGFTGGAQPSSPDEALRVTTLWGLDLAHILPGLTAMAASLTGRTSGSHSADDMGTQQQSLIDALTPRGRETFVSALAAVRQEHYWNRHLATHTIYMLPDLTSVNRYRGYTQTGTRTDSSGRTATMYVIHLSKDLLESGETELATASMVHELSHTVDTNVTGHAMESFESGLAALLADHPQIAALRTGAPDPAAARAAQILRLRQMLFDATGYAEGEIFVHLQQLTHQPSMTVSGSAVRGADFIMDELTYWIRQLRRIGMPPAVLRQILTGVLRRAMEMYDARIAAAPAGSGERQLLELNKQLATAMIPVALGNAGGP